MKNINLSIHRGQSTLIKSVAYLLIGLITSQGAIVASIACIEPDGEIHIETMCLSGTSSIIGDDSHRENNLCQECVDIPLWPEKETHLKTTTQFTFHKLPHYTVLVTPPYRIVTETTNSIYTDLSYDNLSIQAQTALESIRLLI